MNLLDTLAKILTKYGKQNSPTTVVIGVAITKGIFRPCLTMMDKKEDIETKKYTAFREGLTEIIAIPVYYLSGVCALKVSKLLATPKHYMSKDAFSNFVTGNILPKFEKDIEYAKKMATESLPKLETNTRFIGVCLSALLFIPMLCSATIQPLMKSLNLENKKSFLADFRNPFSSEKFLKNSQLFGATNKVNTQPYFTSCRYNCSTKVGAV